mgnify:CR=1 FL=1
MTPTTRACRCGHLEDSHRGRCSYEHCHCEAFTAAEASPATDMLRGLIAFAMKRAKRELDDSGAGRAVFTWSTGENPLAHYYQLPSEHAEIMNSGRGKDLLFGLVRIWVQERKPKAFAICTDAWRGRMTAKAKGLSLDEATKGGFYAAEERGMISKVECINVTAQTPARAMIAFQTYTRLNRMILYEEFAVMEADIDSLGGRLKMYGDLREENLH